MEDQVVEVTSKNYFQRLTESIGGIIIGILLFLCSFAVLWLNEGRTDLSKVVKEQSIAVTDAGKPINQAKFNGKLVSLTGMLKSNEKAEDPLFFKGGNYIALYRHTEMFAWVEHKKTEKKEKMGGTEETTTTYSYSKEWDSRPENSSSFKKSAGHNNPSKDVENSSFMVKTAQIGIYPIDPQKIHLPSSGDIVLKKEFLKTLNKKPGFHIETTEKYVFIGKGSLKDPLVGDMRISFSGVPKNILVTGFGKMADKKLQPFLYKGKQMIYHVREGDRDFAIYAWTQSDKLLRWIIRIVGFLMMWFGLTALFQPLSSLLNFIPLLAQVGRGLAAIVTLVVSLVLSFITILLAVIFYNIIALVILLAVMTTLVVMGLLRKKAKPAEKKA